MYGLIWRTLPGGLAGKLVGCLVLLAAALALLFGYAFPAIEPLLPFSDVTVGTGQAPASVPAASPTG